MDTNRMTRRRKGERNRPENRSSNSRARAGRLAVSMALNEAAYSAVSLAWSEIMVQIHERESSLRRQ